MYRFNYKTVCCCPRAGGGRGDNLQVPVDAQGLRATVDGQPVQIDDMPCMDNQA